ncbi:MAG: LytTR family DNA-binding domain-containing protein [Pseudoxanthomonas suwonensis]|nr:LytTR family DNA-binding domain-containing protein [Pseudoxanthomonas suwonensis]
MTPMRVAIVDDEPLARSRVRRLLQRVAAADVTIVAECADAIELLEAATAQTFDVLFLDIDMPECDAFQAIDRWQGPLPQLVFVTAHPAHGARAFDVRATDYLLKPISAERLADAMQRVRERHGQGHAGDASPPVATKASAGDIPRIPLQIGRQTRLVPVADIDAVLAEGNYVEVRTRSGRYLVREPLQEFAANLDDAFIRIHRSAIVRRTSIVAITPLGSLRYRVELRDGSRIQSSRGHAAAVRELLELTPRSGQ